MFGFFKCGFKVSEFDFKLILNFNFKLSMWRHLEVDHTVEVEVGHQTYFWEHQTKFHEVYVKYFYLVDFIRLDPAEIRRLVGQTLLAVSALIGEASSGVFVLVTVLFNALWRGFLQNDALCFTEMVYNNSYSSHGVGLGVGWPVRERGGGN